jgi:hypothetical protein
LGSMRWPLATEEGEILWTNPNLYQYAWLLLQLGEEDEAKALPPGRERLEREFSQG